MLIVLDDSITNLSRDFTPNEYRSLNNIASAAEQGKHFILGSSSVLEFLISNHTIDYSSRRTYKKILASRSQIAQILDYVSMIVRVTTTVIQIEKELNEKSETTTVLVPLHYFDDFSKVDNCHLLCEDLFDCGFYKTLTNYVISQNNNPFSFDLKMANGGGQNIANNYRNLVEKSNFPCITIIDSDKSFPNAPQKNIITEVQSIYKEQYKMHLTDFYVLKVREIENLIPPHIYSSFNRDYLVYEKMYECAKYKELYYFSDIKSGIKINDFKIIDYLHEQFDLLNEQGVFSRDMYELISNHLLTVNCDSFGKALFTYDENRNKQNKITKGVKSTFRKIYQDIFLYRERLLKNSEIPEEFQKWWNEIALLCFSWGCFYQIKTYC